MTTPDSLFAYYTGCPFGNNTECLIYAYCNEPEINASAPFGFQITGCSLLACPGIPQGDQITSITQFQTGCYVNETGITIYAITGGWYAIPSDGGTIGMQQFFESAFLRYFVTWYVEFQRTFFMGDAYAFAGNVPDCGPFALFRRCPCNTSLVDYDVPYQLPPTDPMFNQPEGPPQFYTCTAGVSSCLCNNAAINVNNLAPANSVGILVENAPDTLRRFRMINNRLQQYTVGISVMQVTHSLVANSSIVVPSRDDLQGIARLIGQQDNEFNSCPIPFLQGSYGSLYSQTCTLEIAVVGPDQPCPITLTTEREADCIVDDRATSDLPGFGVTIFSNIQDAISICTSPRPQVYVLVRANDVSSYYEESLEFAELNKQLTLYSLDGAVVVGEHSITTNADNMTFIGITFIHPQSNQKPLFDIVRAPDDHKDKNVNQLTFENCEFRGGGCRKCGIFETKRLNNLNMSYCRITSWDFFVIKLTDANNFYFSNNVLDETSGRVILVKYAESFYVEQNLLYNCRGQKSISGSVIISLTATDRNACDTAVPGRLCIFRQNIQQVPNITRLTPLYKDGCFYFSGGLVQPSQIYDNACVIAQNGITFVKVPAISPTQLPYVMGLNPLIKPSLMQHRTDRQFRKFQGSDFVLRSTTSSSFSSGGRSFFFSNTVETDFDTFPFLVTEDPPICTANNNYDQRYGFAFGPGLGWPRMGYALFSNATIGIAACTDRSMFASVMNASLVQPGYTLYVTSTDGSRVSPNVLNFQRDGQIFGLDVVAACCQGPDWRPAIMGVGHQLQAAYHNFSNLELSMPWAPGPFNMVTARPTDYTSEEITRNPEPLGLIIPAETIITNCIFNGRNIIPGQQGYVWDTLVGQPIPPKFFKAKTTKVPPYTQSMMWVLDTVARDFPAFSDTETAGDNSNYLSVGWPYFGVFRVQAINRINTNTNVTFRNFTSINADFDAIEVYFFNNQTLAQCFFYNCSGRAYGNRQCIQLLGNDLSALLINSRKVNATQLFLDSPSQLQVHNITQLNTAEVLYPTDNAASNPGFVTFLVLNGWPTTSNLCVIGGQTDGLYAALRYELMENTTIIQCNELPFFIAPTFPDRARFLRAICVPANLTFWRGVAHDLGFGAPSTDSQGNTIWCDSSAVDQCCPLVNPDQCYVTQNGFLLNASNPWLHRFVFATICEAIQFCEATHRLITVIGSADPFGTGDTSPKIYTEVINCQVPLVWPGANATGPLIIQATANVTLRASGHKLDTQCIRTSFMGFTFENPGPNPSAGGAPTWNQPLAPAMCNLSFTGNRWTVINNWPHIYGLVGTGFTINSNLFRGFIGSSTLLPPDTYPRNAVIVFGTCLEYNVTIVGNRFEKFLGNGLHLQNVSQYWVQSNTFKTVGGMDDTYPVPDTSTVFVSDCAAPSLGTLPTTFKNNHVSTTQTAVATLGKMATCWVDSVRRDLKPYKITLNVCVGLDFGLRLNNLLPYNPPSDDPKRILRQYAINYGNVRSVGNKHVGPLNKQFDIVASNPYEDDQMIATPDASFYTKLWCTNGCPQSPWILVGTILAVIALLVLLCLLACLVTSCCTPAHYRERYRVWRSNAADYTRRLHMANVLAESPDITKQVARIDAQLAARREAALGHPIARQLRTAWQRLTTPIGHAAYRPLWTTRAAASQPPMAEAEAVAPGQYDDGGDVQTISVDAGETVSAYADDRPLLPVGRGRGRASFRDENSEF
jgi:hypothetical protein